MYEVLFNDISSFEYNIVPVRRPSIPAPERNITETTIPGRDGELVTSDNSYKPITIDVEFNFMSTPNSWAQTFRNAKKWLAGKGKLSFSDDPGYFYDVYYVRISDSERSSTRIGSFAAQFVCNPYTYLTSGNTQINFPSQSITNNYDVSHPLYYISGTGVCTITINGKEFEANVSGSMYIDSDLMISCKNNQNMSTFVTGDYEDLWLQSGVNTVAISSGFTAKITPRWRCL